MVKSGSCSFTYCFAYLDRLWPNCPCTKTLFQKRLIAYLYFFSVLLYQLSHISQLLHNQVVLIIDKKTLKLFLEKKFHEFIRSYKLGKKKFKQNYILLNGFLNLVEFCIDILYTFMKLRIFGQSKCTLIIGRDNYYSCKNVT